jgi:hypothetical protein
MNQALYAHMNNKRKMKKKSFFNLIDIMLSYYSFDLYFFDSINKNFK